MCDTVRIKSWKELVTFVEGTNTDTHDVILCGWIRDYKKGATTTKYMFFRRVPIAIEDGENNTI